MFIPVYSWLRASSILSAYLGEPLRVYRFVAPQDARDPYIVWNVVAGTVENYLTDPPGMDNAIVQFDIYGRDEQQMEDMSIALSRTLQDKGHQRGVPRDMYEGPPSKLLRVSIDYSFWENRSPISPL